MLLERSRQEGVMKKPVLASTIVALLLGACATGGQNLAPADTSVFIPAGNLGDAFARPAHGMDMVHVPAGEAISVVPNILRPTIPPTVRSGDRALPRLSPQGVQRLWLERRKVLPSQPEAAVVAAAADGYSWSRMWL